MSFTDHAAFSDGPEKICPEKFGGLLAVFKPGVLEGHERAGYTFRPKPCLDVVAYDPDYCQPGDVKMDPGHYGPQKETILGMIQTAIVCSTIGATVDELREAARTALADKLERAIDADFIVALAAVAVDQTPAPLLAKCVLAEAAQFLSNSSECGRGLIVGPIEWFEQLENTLVWNNAKGYHTDYVGNIVIPHSVDNETVYALDMAVEIKISDVQLLDELAPGITRVNDRVVRAEQLYTIAVDSCRVGSFDVAACCDCGSGGGGGGGGSVTVTNFPANQNVTVSNFPAPPANQNVTVTNFPPTAPDFDVENLVLCDVDADFNVVGSALLVYTYDETTGLPVGAPQIVDPLTHAPYVPLGTLQPCPGNRPATVTAQHFDVQPGTPWTPALSGGKIITSVTYTVVAGLADVTDQNGDVIAGIPTPYTGTWSSDPNGRLVAPLQIAAQPGGRVIVLWNELTI